MTGFHAASEYVKTCFVALCCTALIMALSYGAPYWTTAYNGNAGLWHGCTWGICYERWDYWTSAWIKASQAFMSLALICITFSMVTLGAFIFHRYFDEDKRMVVISMILSFATSFFVLLAVIIWGASEHYGNGEVLNWAFALACVCSLATFGIGWFLHMEVKRPVK